MLRALRDLAIALVNATLLLVALALFLAWQLTRTVDAVVTGLGESLQVVRPLRAEIGGLNREMRVLRADLGRLAAETGGAGNATLTAVNDRLARIETRLERSGERVDALAALPDRIVAQAVRTAVDRAADRMMAGIREIRQCTPTADEDTKNAAEGG